MGSPWPGGPGGDGRGDIAPSRGLRSHLLLLAFGLALVCVCVGAGPAFADTHITSDVTSDTTWTAVGSPYILDTGNLKVAAGATLTIQPGVMVEFNTGAYDAFTVNGTVKAIGTAASPITFTSSAGANGAGAPGQWYNISISSGNASSQFSYTNFYYGGTGSGGCYAYAEFQVNSGSTVSIDHSDFEHSAYSAIGVNGGTANVSYSTLEHNCSGIAGGNTINITHSTIAYNTQSGSGIYGGNGAFFNSPTTGSSFKYDTITGNSNAGIQLLGNCTNPASSYPWGEYNNIYGNDPSSPGTQQVNTFTPPVYNACNALPVDWRNNFWGNASVGSPDVGYNFAPSGCSPYLGNMTYNTDGRGPMTSGSTTVNGTSCNRDTFKIGPGDFLLDPVPNAGATPNAGAPDPLAPNLRGGPSPWDPNFPHCDSTSRPVNCQTGNFWETSTDLRVPGRNDGLTFTRTYNSQEAANASAPGMLGYGWAFEFGETLTIDPSSQAASVRHANGSIATFLPNGDGTYSAPAWVQSTLSKNSDGSYTYTLPHGKQFVFNASGQLVKTQDRNGNATTLSYNGSSQLATVTEPTGRTLGFTYNAAGQIQQITDPAGYSVGYTYDGSGNLQTVTDVAGGTTTYTYDARHQLLTATDPRSGKLTNVYDTSERVASQTDPANRTTTFTYSTGDTKITDPAGNVTDEQFTNNEPTSITKAQGTSAEATSTYSYDSNLNETRMVDANHHTWTYGYDAAGNRTSVTDPLNHTTTWTFNGTRDVTSAIKPSGQETDYGYDANGNLKTVTRTLTETNTQLQSTYSYDGYGQLLSAVDPLNHSWTYGYDSNGNRTSATSPLGNKTTWSYDADSRVRTYTTARGNVTGANPADYTTTITRNPFGDPLTITDPHGNLTTYVYDGDRNLTDVTDRDIRHTHYDYNADNQVTKVTRPDGSTQQTGYDADGKVNSQTDGLNHPTSYGYDAQERVTSATDPLNRTTAFGYDPVGNQTSKTDPQSRTTTYGYDNANQLSSINDSSGNPAAVSLGYNADGQRTSMSDASGATTYTFDSIGRLTSQTNGSGQKTTYGYDNASRLTSIGYPKALSPLNLTGTGGQQQINTGSVTRTYYDDGTLKTVSDWLGNTHTFSYNPEQQLTATARPNSTSASYGYDANGNMTSLTDVGGQTSYSYTNAGLLASVTPPGGQPQSYGYDSVGRLTQVGSNPSAYTYDNADNPTQVVAGSNETGQTFDAANQLTGTTNPSSGPTALAYDSLGQRTNVTPQRASATSYAYDQAGQLISAQRKRYQQSASAGYTDTLVLRDDGTIWGSGSNTYGQLGDGTTTTRSGFVQVQGLSGVQSVAAGYYHSLAVAADKTVWAWGVNNYGQLGNNSTTDAHTPIQVPSLSSMTAVSAGEASSVALKSDGTVWSWGQNTYGQLGNNSTTDSHTPVQVQGLTGVTQIAAGYAHNLALKSDGTVWAWGLGSSGQLGNNATTTALMPVQVQGLSGVVAITAGWAQSLALKSDGTVWAWGWNGDGQLGDGTTTNRLTPVQVQGLSSVSQISTGAWHTMAMTSSGTVYAWGDNGNGELGQSTAPNTGSTTPIQVPGVTASQVSAGGAHEMAMQTTGTLTGWGYNADGELADATTTNRTSPVLIRGFGTAQPFVSAGYQDTMLLRDDGTVWGTGQNTYGQLGDGSTTNRSNFVQVQQLANVRSVAAGYYHSLAIAADKTVRAWGLNSSGQLGNNSTTNSSAPVPVQSLSNATAVGAGNADSVALKSDGTVWAWGYNGDGELGNNSTTNSSVPVQVQGLSGVTQIAVGYGTNLALKSDGTVWAWGLNNVGELGNNSTTNSTVPVQVQGLTNVVSISTSYAHTLALKSDGTVWAWGYNANAQLGDGTTTNRLTPVQIHGLGQVSQIGAGAYESATLSPSGTLQTWGDNTYGEGGDPNNTSTNILTPSHVPGVSGATQISAGGVNIAAVQDTGALVAFGYNYYGEIGDGTTTNAKTPEHISSVNLLQHVAPASVYTYDGDGQRQTKTVNNILTNSGYDIAEGLPLQITDGANAYIYGPAGVPIEEITADDSARYLGQDRQGSATTLTDQGGHTIAMPGYDSYGNATGSGTWEQPFGYNGQYTDSETGFQYLRARYYDMTTAQFLTRDPLGSKTRQSYGYAAADPVNAGDPSGLQTSVTAPDLGEGFTPRPDLGQLPGFTPSPSLPGEGFTPTIDPGSPEGFTPNAELGPVDPGFTPLCSSPNIASNAANVDDPSSLQGLSPEEIARIAGEAGLVAGPTSGVGGTKYVFPGTKGSDQIRVMPGNPGDPNPVKRGPYVRVSRGGNTYGPYPLSGNPALGGVA